MRVSTDILFSNSGSKTLAFRRFYVYNFLYGSLPSYFSHPLWHQVALCLDYQTPKPLLSGTIATRVGDLVRHICTEMEAEILKGHVSKDHVHLYVSCPPHVSPSALMQQVKGRSSRKLTMEFAEIRKACWGRHVWARGFFVASSGNVTD